MKRVAALKSFLTALQVLKAEIVFKRSALPDIMALLQRECTLPASEFFHQVGEAMEGADRPTFFQAFRRCQGELRKMYLEHSDIEVLESAARVAGKYDAELQAEVLNAAIRRLEEELTEAADEKARKGRLYRAVGISAGIMIALIMV